MNELAAQIEALPGTLLTAAEVAPILGFTPQSIRIQAQEAPEMLGFPVIVAGTRVKIPKDGLLYYLRYGRPVVLNPEEELRYGKDA